MTKITLYTGGGVSLSPVYAEGRAESNYVRLIANEGMMLQKDEQTAECVDVLKTDVANWSEVEFADDPDLDDSEALSILLGGDGE